MMIKTRKSVMDDVIVGFLNTLQHQGGLGSSTPWSRD